MTYRTYPVLDFFRILSVSLMAWILGSETFFNFSFYPSSLWQPQGVLQFFELNQISADIIRVTLYLFWISTVCAFLGFYTRSALLVVGITTTLLYSLKMSFGFMNHRESALIMTFFILSAYPVNSRLSLDFLLLKKRASVTKSEVQGLLLCLRFFLCLIYFSAGISKLQAHGLEWITTPTLQYYLLFCDVMIPNNWAQQIWPHAGYSLAAYPTLCQALSAFVIILELSAPLAFIRWLRPFIIGGLLLLQLSIFLFLKISFIHLAPLFLAWLPWEKWFYLEPTRAATK